MMVGALPLPAATSMSQSFCTDNEGERLASIFIIIIIFVFILWTKYFFLFKFLKT